MANLNQIVMTKNSDVSVEDNKVIKLVNPFKKIQQNPVDDFSLFFGDTLKCRCCFSKLDNNSGKIIIESWHKPFFLAMTGVEMSMPDSENCLCLKCAEILKIFNELGKSAANMQKSYNNLMQDLASDIKTEKEDVTDEISVRMLDGVNIAISDGERCGDVNEHDLTMQPQQTTSSYTIESEMFHNEDVRVKIVEEKLRSIDREVQTFNNNVSVKNCTVWLTRLDSETVNRYEHHSTIRAESKKGSHDDNESKMNSNFSNCHLCGVITKNGRTLNNHLKQVHHLNLKMSCDLCGKSILRRYSLIDHMQTYHMNIKFSCDLCSSECQSELKLKSHKRFVHKKQFKCQKCDTVFGFQTCLAQHVKVKHEGMRFHCSYPGCSMTFTSKSNTTRHLHDAHSGKRIKKLLERSEIISQNKTQCHFCGKVSKDANALYDHLRKNHKTEYNKEGISCDLCGKSFLNKNNLIDHMQTAHMNIKFNCTLCSEEFRSIIKLRSHQGQVHYKKFKCRKCNVAFGKPIYLANHVKVKHEGMLFHCSYPGCSKTLATKSSIIQHLRQVHSLGEDNFKKYKEKITLQ